MNRKVEIRTNLNLVGSHYNINLIGIGSTCDVNLEISPRQAIKLFVPLVMKSLGKLKKIHDNLSYLGLTAAINIGPFTWLKVGSQAEPKNLIRFLYPKGFEIRFSDIFASLFSKTTKTSSDRK